MATLTRRRALLAGFGSTAVLLAGCTNDDSDGGASPDGDSTPTDAPSGNALDRTTDVVYAFAPDRLSVVAPDTGEILGSTDGFEDADWGDVRVASDGERLYAVDGNADEVVRFDTETAAVTERIGVGAGPTHMYVAGDGELWAHADEEGTFYVVDTATDEVIDRVVAGFEEAGHGKLVYSSDLGGKAYATNTNDAALHVLDVESRERVDSIEVGDSGTHYGAYSAESGHVYVEPTGGDVTTVVDTETDEVVDVIDAVGGLYASPDGRYVSIVDGGDETVHVLDASSDEVVASLDVSGGPDSVLYAESGGTLYGFTTNTTNAESAVVDFDAMDVVDTVDVGDIRRPDGADFLHRDGAVGGGYFVTPADGDDVVSVVDVETWAVLEAEVADVGTVAYVGEP